MVADVDRGGSPAPNGEQLAQPQPQPMPGRGSVPTPGLGVTFHYMQLLDPDGERR